MSLAARMRGDARLCILQSLAEDRGYSVNHRILREMVDRSTAITLTEAEIREHLSWLEDRKAVLTEEVPPFTIARLTDYGQALAEGRDFLEGVSRPSPGQLG